MNKILMPVGDASETVDTLYPHLRVQEEGFEPVFAAPEVRKYQMVMHELQPGWHITKEWRGYSIQADVAFRDVEPEEYVGVFFSGGRAPEYIRDDPDLIRITRYFFAHDKPIASVCHGVEIPARAGCVKGRRMACVPKCQFDLEVCGGIFVDEPFTIDGNLISGTGWPVHGLYMKQWVELLIEERERMQDRVEAVAAH